MGLMIEDGKGKGFIAGVSKDNRLETSSKSSIRSFYISRDDGQVFNLNSHDASAAAGTLIAYWKNTSTTRKLVIDLLRVGAIEAALWKVWFVTGIASGSSLLIPTNMNSTSSNIADAVARGNGAIADLTLGVQIANVRTPATESFDIPFSNTLIIGQGDAIAVEYDTGTTGIAEVLIRGFYEE